MKMNVAIVTPYISGGMLQYASQLSNALTERMGVTQIVGEEANTSLFDDRVTVHEIPFPTSAASFPKETIRLLRSRIGHILGHADVVHLTGNHITAALLLPLFRGKPLVYTLHDVDTHTGEYRLSGEVADRLLVHNSDCVLVHGEYNKQAFVERYGDDSECESIMHGDYSFFKSYCETDHDYTTRELLFFGRIRPYKDLETLVGAERLLSDRLDNYRITIAGDGPIDEGVAGKIAASDNITLLNSYIPNEEVCELFNRCRAVVLPYRDSSQTGVIPIAYSFKKSVVASNVGGIPDVVDHGMTGYLVEPGNPAELADRCAALLCDPKLARELGEQADQFRQEHMAWDSIAREIENIYKSVC